MQNRSVRIPILAIAIFSVLALFVCPAGAQAPKPITKQGLIDALRIGGLTLQELIQFVRDRGVDFQVTPEIEAELRSAAAQRELIEAVRGSFRGQAAPGGAVVAAAPLSKSEIVTLLQVGTPPARIEQLVGERGANFSMTPGGRSRARGRRRQHGADRLDRPAGSPGGCAPRQPRRTSRSRRRRTPAAAGPRPTPNITSLRDMKRIYIDKMPADLDQFIRAEIQKEVGRPPDRGPGQGGGRRPDDGNR